MWWKRYNKNNLIEMLSLFYILFKYESRKLPISWNDKKFCMAFPTHKIYTKLRNMKINEVEMSILKLPFHCNDNCKKFYNSFNGIFIVKNRCKYYFRYRGKGLESIWIFIWTEISIDSYYSVELYLTKQNSNFY